MEEKSNDNTEMQDVRTPTYYSMNNGNNKNNGNRTKYGLFFTVFVAVFAAAIIFLSLKNDDEESAGTETPKYAHLFEEKYKSSFEDFKNRLKNEDYDVSVTGGGVKCKDGSDSVKCNMDNILVSLNNKEVLEIKNISVSSDGFDKKNVSKFNADFIVDKDVKYINNGKIECIRTISGKKSENSIYDDVNCKFNVDKKVDFNLYAETVLNSKDFNKDKLSDMMEYVAGNNVDSFDNVTFKINKLDLSVKSDDLFGYIYKIANTITPMSEKDLLDIYEQSKKGLAAVALLYIPDSLSDIDNLFTEFDKVMKNNYNSLKAEFSFGDTVFTEDMDDEDYKQLLEKLNIKFSSSK